MKAKHLITGAQTSSAARRTASRTICHTGRYHPRQNFTLEITLGQTGRLYDLGFVLVMFYAPLYAAPSHCAKPPTTDVGSTLETASCAAPATVRS
jgi:hypothetical protein